MGHRAELPSIDRETLEDWRDALSEIFTPATDDQIAINIERLRANYPEFEDLDEAVLAMVIEDLLNDMTGYPIAFLTEACARWRNSAATRAPTAGQLKAMVSKEYESAFRKKAMVSVALQAYAELA